MKKRKYKNEHDKWVKYLKPRYQELQYVREAQKERTRKYLKRLKKNDPKKFEAQRQHKMKYLRAYKLRNKTK